MASVTHQMPQHCNSAMGPVEREMFPSRLHLSTVSPALRPNSARILARNKALMEGSAHILQWISSGTGEDPVFSGKWDLVGVDPNLLSGQANDSHGLNSPQADDQAVRKSISCGDSSWLRIVHHADRDKIQDIWLANLQCRTGFAVEFQLNSSLPQEQFVAMHCVPVLGESNNKREEQVLLTGGADVVEWIGICHNITDNRRAQAMAAAQARMLEKIASGGPLQKLLHEICVILEDFTESAWVSVLLADVETMTIKHGAAPSLPWDYIKVVDGMPIRDNLGSCPTAMFRKQTIIVQDIETNTLWASAHELATRFGLHSCSSSPIIGKDGEVLGAFALYYPRKNVPSTYDWSVIELGVNVVRIAIEANNAERLMVQSEARYRSLVMATAQDVWVAKPSGEVLSHSPKWEEITGQSTEDYKGGGWLEAVHPEDKEAVRAGWAEALKSKTMFVHECRLRRVARSPHTPNPNARAESKLAMFRSTSSDEMLRQQYFLAKAVPVTDSDGAISEWIGTFTDISKEKEAEMLLLRSRDNLKVEVAERTDELRFRQEAVDTLYKLTLERFGSFAEKAKAFLAAGCSIFGLEIAAVLEHRLAHDDALLSAGSKAGLSLPAGSHDVLEAIAVECPLLVQRSRTTESGVAEPENKIQCENIKSGLRECTLLVLEHFSPCVLWNEENGKILRDLTDFPTGWQYLEKTTESASIETYLGVPIHTNGKLIGVLLFASQKGLPISFLRRCTDLVLLMAQWICGEMEREISDTQLKRATVTAEKATKAKSTFLATMSHEIRTPMNAVLGMTSLLLNTRLTEEQLDLVNTIRSSGDALLALINDILDFSKIESSKLDLEHALVDLRLCVEEAVCLLGSKASEKGLELSYVFDPEVPRMIIGDLARIRQVLVNLISNAIKFTATGEVNVTIKARSQEPLLSAVSNDDAIDISSDMVLTTHVSDGESNCRTLRSPIPAVAEISGQLRQQALLLSDSQLEISNTQQLASCELTVCVSDSGIGIAKDRMDRLFNSFSQVDRSITRQYGGTGLGLAICKRLVELMGGKIWVKSTPGIGSSFFFSLPCAVPLSPTANTSTPVQSRQSALNLESLQLTHISKEGLSQRDRATSSPSLHHSTQTSALSPLELDQAVLSPSALRPRAISVTSPALNSLLANGSPSSSTESYSPAKSIELHWENVYSYTVKPVKGKDNKDSSELETATIDGLWHKFDLTNRAMLVIVPSMATRNLIERQAVSWKIKVTSVASLEELPSVIGNSSAGAAAKLGTYFDFIILDEAGGRDGVRAALKTLRFVWKLQSPTILLTSSLHLSGAQDKSLDNTLLKSKSSSRQLLEDAVTHDNGLVASPTGTQTEPSTRSLVQAFLAKPVRQSQFYEILLAILSPSDGDRKQVLQREKPSVTYDVAVGERNPLRILLAEDNPVNSKLALMMLSRLGYKADLVTNGVQALSAIEANTYDVVLMDVSMPEMDGITAAKLLCERTTPDTRPRIVALTANAMTEDREMCFEAGMDDYCSKPIRLECLLDVLGRSRRRES